MENERAVFFLRTFKKLSTFLTATKVCWGSVFNQKMFTSELIMIFHPDRCLSESPFIPLNNTVCIRCTDNGLQPLFCSSLSHYFHILSAFPHVQNWFFFASGESLVVRVLVIILWVIFFSTLVIRRPVFAVVIPNSRSVSKSWEAFQACFEFCVCAALPGRDPNWSPQSWFESCSPRGSTQDLDSQTEDTWFPEKANQNKSDRLTYKCNHLRFFFFLNMPAT